jgi:hypothetical protein
LGIIYSIIVLTYALASLFTEGIELMLISKYPQLKQIWDANIGGSEIGYDPNTKLLIEIKVAPPYQRYFILQHLQLLFKPISSTARMFFSVLLVISITLVIIVETETIITTWLMVPVIGRHTTKFGVALRQRILNKYSSNSTPPVTNSGLSEKNADKVPYFKVWQEVLDEHNAKIAELDRMFGAPKTQNEQAKQALVHTSAEKFSEKSKFQNDHTDQTSNSKEDGPGLLSSYWTKVTASAVIGGVGAGLILHIILPKKNDKI